MYSILIKSYSSIGNPNVKQHTNTDSSAIRSLLLSWGDLHKVDEILTRLHPFRQPYIPLRIVNEVYGKLINR